MGYKTLEYNFLPQEAMAIRTAVFVDEQGFADEYDDIDEIATHMVMFDGDKAIACCRYFPAERDGAYYLGRMAVAAEYRAKGVGKQMMTAAERSVKAKGGFKFMLHAQCQASGFYLKCGYTASDKEDEEQGCPHVWMYKSF